MKPRNALFSTLLIAVSMTAHAEVNLSGFATFAGGTTLNDNEQLEGYDSDFGFDAKSKVAVQLSSSLNSKWDVTAQLISRGSESWQVDAEWAYAGYQVNDNWKLLFGRQRAPFYLYSDYLDVSYAYHWISPPSGVYSLPFDSFDGIGSVYNFESGNWYGGLHLTFGRNNQRAQLLGAERNSDFWNFFASALTMNYDWLTLRASFARTDFSVELTELSPLLDAWQLIGFSQVADNIQIFEDDGWFAGLAASIDKDDYLLVFEYTEVHPGDNIFPQQDSYYLSVGKRFDDHLLYLTVGADSDNADDILGGIPSGVDPQLDALILQTQGLLSSTEEDSKYWSIGMRWELDSSVALKTEYSRYSDDVNPLQDASLLQLAITTVF